MRLGAKEMAYSILSTKKLNLAVRERLKLNDFELSEEEFIRIDQHISADAANKLRALSDDDVVIFTSKNGVNSVRTIIDCNIRLKVFCISGKTKQEVLETFANAEILGSAVNGKKLAEKIIPSGIAAATFICGNIRRDELPQLLSQKNITVDEVVVYDTIETPKAIEQSYNAVLFFSPSAVKSFFSVNNVKKETVCFCIGETTAETVKIYSGAKVITASAPTQELLAEQIKTYFKQVEC